MLVRTIVAFAVSAALYAPNSHAECPPTICAEDTVDVAGVTEKIEENKEAQEEAKKEGISTLLTDMFESKAELPGQECLDGLQSINISASFVDITSGYPNLLAALMEQIINAACDAVVTAANKEIEKANNSITDFGDKMSEQTFGLASVESDGDGDGSFSFDTEVKSIQDMPAMKEATDAWNKKVGETLYGKDGYRDQGGNAASDTDLSADRFYSEESDYAGEYEGINENLGEKAQEKIDNAACWLTEDC